MVLPTLALISAPSKLPPMKALLLTGGRIIDPANRFDAVGDLLIAEGKIAALGAQAAAQAPSGRFTYAHEVADLVLMLASDRSANITGSDFVIDGGLITTL